MDTLLVIGLVAFVVLLLGLMRPTPTTQIVYVPVEVGTAPRGGIGCLPLVVIGLVLLVARGVIRF